MEGICLCRISTRRSCSLSEYPSPVCTVETTVDGKRFATPRGWEDLSQLIQVYESLGKKADRDVVGQYLQHPKIARIFANYLELYYKYQDQYQVDEIAFRHNKRRDL